MNNYFLVNPQVMGTMQTKFTTHNDRDAGLMAFREMSRNFSNNVPFFNFTLRRGKNYVHFIAREKTNSDGNVKFTVKEMEISIDNTELQKFIQDTEPGFTGGAFKYYDDDSSSSSNKKSNKSYTYHKKPLADSPITHWQYYPKIYPYQYLYMPQFTYGLNPYVYLKFEIDFDIP